MILLFVLWFACSLRMALNQQPLNPGQYDALKTIYDGLGSFASTHMNALHDVVPAQVATAQLVH
jgi:hypothetical protein